MTPPLNVKLCQTDKRNDGLILLTVGRNTRSIRKTSEFEALIGIDRQGKVVLQKEFDFCLMDCRQSRSDTLLLMATNGSALEMSYTGEILHHWYCPDRFPKGISFPKGVPLKTPKLHHTICELSNGLLASLSIEHLPLDQPRGDWTHLMGDTIVLFDRNGRIENEISLAGILDVNRHSHDSTAPYWPHQGWPGTLDWSHANCLIEDPKDGGYLISFRHQDAVIKVSAAGELVWILGHPAGWQAPWSDKLLRVEGGRLFYHQHDLSFTRNGELMLYNNGTAGAFPPEPRQPLEERQSFALSYKIDEEKMTATETWRYGGNDIPYSHYVSGVCELPNGNRFIASTGIKLDLEGKRVEGPPLGVGSIDLVEVTRSGERVFHAIMQDPDAIPEAGWNGFRPEYVTPEAASQLTF